MSDSERKMLSGSQQVVFKGVTRTSAVSGMIAGGAIAGPVGAGVGGLVGIVVGLLAADKATDLMSKKPVTDKK